MRRWLLVALALLLALTGALINHALEPSSSASHQHAALPADALALDLSAGAPDSPSLLLGTGTGTGDILDSSMARTLQTAGLRVLRFGDIHADDYDWQQGCIYGDIGSKADCYGIAGESGKLDQFLHFAGQVGAQPLIVVNGEIDDPQQAAGLVAYYWKHCIHAPHQQCPDPYWEIGDSPATWRHFAVPLRDRQLADAQTISPDQYAALVISYAAAMSEAALYYEQPNHPIKIVADEWITGATDQSWIDAVINGGIDTHYAPLLYQGSGRPPTVQDVVSAVQQGYNGRPGVDSWIQDLRDSLAQFSQSSSIQIIVGRWSMDANPPSRVEPAVYGSYAQALFTAQMFAHVFQDAQSGGPNPIVLAVQAPMTGQAQEPFDIPTFEPRAAIAVYTLVGRYFGSYPIPLRLGAGVRNDNLVAAASLIGREDARVLLMNTDSKKSHSVDLQNLPSGLREMWWISPNSAMPAGVSAIHHMMLSGSKIVVPPWAIAVVRVRI